MSIIRTQIAIIGAGPAGLLLAQLLHQHGIDSVVLETRSREYIEHRLRAGVLEHPSVEILKTAGVGERLLREGLVHRGIHLQFAGAAHRIDIASLTGKTVTVYGQQDVVRDLVAARLDSARPLFFEVGHVSVHDIDTQSPLVRFQSGGVDQTIACDFVAGCDGFHGICRDSIPADRLTTFERAYPFAWLGVLADTPPPSEELIYASHERGFALLSMRSADTSRLYLQCKPDESIQAWSDERVWSELETRLGRTDAFHLTPGPVLQKSVTPMRSFVTEPMQYGRLFLAGDAAHIVPPTGAKGMNLAIADVSVLADAFASYYTQTNESALAAYSATCLSRVWQVQRFSWWMTTLLHRFDEHTAFDRRRQLAELEYVVSSDTAARALAENYVGLPLAR